MKRISALLLIVLLSSCNSEQETKPGFLYPDENGVSIPKNYHIGWPVEAWGEVDGKRFKLDEENRILERLESEDIEFKITTYHGRKFLVWNENDDDSVQKIINNN